MYCLLPMINWLSVLFMIHNPSPGALTCMDTPEYGYRGLAAGLENPRRYPGV